MQFLFKETAWYPFNRRYILCLSVDIARGACYKILHVFPVKMLCRWLCRAADFCSLHELLHAVPVQRRYMWFLLRVLHAVPVRRHCKWFLMRGAACCSSNVYHAQQVDRSGSLREIQSLDYVMYILSLRLLLLQLYICRNDAEKEYCSLYK